MEPSISHGTVRHRITDSDAITPSGKRSKIDSQHDNYNDNVSQLQIQSKRDDDVSCDKNVASTAESGTSDHVNSSSFINSVIDDSISDLKAVCLPEESFMSVNGSFSRDTSASTVVCLQTEETESVSVNEATSRRKPSSPAAYMPSAAELEEFFAKAEQNEQKRFTKKYNYDIVKDVPVEGRYQWVRLKP